MTRAVIFLEVSAAPINRDDRRNESQAGGSEEKYLFTFQQPIGRLDLPLRFQQQNPSRCQDPCLETSPTGLPLVQWQRFTP
ncbi:hypothetical protein TNCV_4233331 [Trichonephila clavipes]|nr:hypothetical protein TNCV_4233331 [Trichonephila clavipes]